MSLDLDVVSRVMYLQHGDINPGDEMKVARFERKMEEWISDVVDKVITKSPMTKPSKEKISFDMFQLEKSFGGYWCEGEECKCKQSHWGIHVNESNCWDCMHDPCACTPPLLWDNSEKAYYRFCLSGDGKTKKKWLSEPSSD